MAQTLSAMLRDGQSYMKAWPMKKELYALFPECRVILGTKLAIKVMPPLAVLSCAVLANVQGLDYFPQALVVGLFFLSIPMQGVMWLGHRSVQPLPPSLHRWYRQIHDNMRLNGCQLNAPKTRPRYIELAQLLKRAFDDLDKSFSSSLFQ